MLPPAPPPLHTHNTSTDETFLIPSHHHLPLAWLSRLPHADYFPSIFHCLPLIHCTETLPTIQSALLLHACLEQSPNRSARSPIRGPLSFSSSEQVTSKAVGCIKLLWHAPSSTWQLGHNSCLCLHPSGTHSQVVVLTVVPKFTCE